MKKSDRIAEFVQGFDDSLNKSANPHLVGYFECFNSGRYYEAHDVLEDLWLRQGREHGDYAFHKGLIQLAGGFVHLRLHSLHPDHHKHERRLAPARRLLLLAADNLGPYAPSHCGVDVAGAICLAEKTAALINKSELLENPWSPDLPPKLAPLA